jgi:hypothetical protein
VRAVHVPKLLATGEFDSDAVALASGCRARGSAAQPRSSSSTRAEHGTDILEFGDPAAADEFRRSVLDLLAGI